MHIKRLCVLVSGASIDTRQILNVKGYNTKSSLGWKYLNSTQISLLQAAVQIVCVLLWLLLLLQHQHRYCDHHHQIKYEVTFIVLLNYAGYDCAPLSFLYPPPPPLFHPLNKQ